MKKKSLSELIEELKIMNILYIGMKLNRRKPEREKFQIMWIRELEMALKKRGIHQLYTHQYTAFQTVQKGESIVAVTPTASGKTLCYNLPVLQAIAENDGNRALYLFPTKALAQDQKSELNEIIHEMGIDIKSFTYDGDTSPVIRQKVRKAGISSLQILICSILPSCHIIQNG